MVHGFGWADELEKVVALWSLDHREQTCQPKSGARYRSFHWVQTLQLLARVLQN